MNDTAHDRDTAQVAHMTPNTTWQQLDDARIAGLNAQRAGLVEERNALRAQNTMLDERDDLRAWIIEASSAFRNDGGTDTLDEALGLVRMCHEGAAALVENADLRARIAELEEVTQ